MTTCAGLTSGQLSRLVLVACHQAAGNVDDLIDFGLVELRDGIAHVTSAGQAVMPPLMPKWTAEEKAYIWAVES